MSGFETDITDMVDDLLAVAGESFTYSRGSLTTSGVNMRKSTRPPMAVEMADGTTVEVRPYDFILRTSALPYGAPKAGDIIRDGTYTYEVQPTTHDKVSLELGTGMTRIHSQRINS